MWWALQPHQCNIVERSCGSGTKHNYVTLSRLFSLKHIYTYKSYNNSQSCLRNKNWWQIYSAQLRVRVEKMSLFSPSLWIEVFFMKWKELTSKFKVSSYLVLLLTNKVAGPSLFSCANTLIILLISYSICEMRISLEKYPQQEVCSQNKGVCLIRGEIILY